MRDARDRLPLPLPSRAPAAVMGMRGHATVSDAQFRGRMGAWRALLAAQDGANFALYIEDSIEFAAALLGAWQAGKTIWLGADTLAASCAALAGQVDGFLGAYPAACAPLQPPGDASVDAAGPQSLAADFPALVVFTSGSTGAPQAIAKQWSQLASELATLDQLFGAAAGDAAIIATVSHQHIYGLLFKVLWPLASGRAIHAHSIIYPEELAPALAAGPCVLVTSPAHLKRLPEHLDWHAARAQLRAVFSSGGPLAPEAAFDCARMLGAPPHEVYGSSETGGVAWRQRHAGSDGAWRVFPTVEWQVGPDDGLLMVRSPHLPDASWWTTADSAVAAGDSQFILLGRSDRIVKIEEKRVSLDAIEAGLLASGLVLEARVLLCADGAQGRQRVAAVVVPNAEGEAIRARDGKAALNLRLRHALAGSVETVALPRRWRYAAQLPANAQGKTTQAALLALFDDAPAPRLPQVHAIERDEAALRVTMTLSAPANLYYFDGHFDQAAILPGVVQVEWAIAYGRQYFELPPAFGGINALKFQQVITPGQIVQLELVHDTAKGSLNFRYSSDAGQHASGRVMFGPGAANV